MTREFRSSGSSAAFTLIELLVVTAIIALLVAIVMPALGKARETSKLAVCGTRLRQVGCGIHVYANEYRGLIPRGPDSAGPYDFTASTLATNQLWIGVGPPEYPADHPREYTGLGRLLEVTVREESLYFCPADGSFNLQEEMPKIETDDDAYGSFLYRQIDHLPGEPPLGQLDALGTNVVAGRSVPVEALALDTNSLGAGPAYHVNHRAIRANILFRDGSVIAFRNIDDALAIPAEAFDDYSTLPQAIDQLLTNADYGYRGAPHKAPTLGAE